MDLVTDLPRTQRGNDSVLVLGDSLSKMAHFVPTTKTVSASGLVELPADRLVRYHGFPQKLVSDRDPRFVSDVWKRFCNRFDIKRALSTAHHPQTDGQTERVNSTLEQMLRTYLQADEAAWESLLPALELAYNCAPHSSTELSPFEIMIGENPVTAENIDVISQLAPTLTPPMTKLLKALCCRAQAHIALAKHQQKLYADLHRREVEYEVGDKVWLDARHLSNNYKCSKLAPRHLGAFRITERIGKVAYRLALPPSLECHDVFHVSLLSADRPRHAEQQAPEAPLGWKPVNREHNIYDVEAILGKQTKGRISD